MPVDKLAEDLLGISLQDRGNGKHLSVFKAKVSLIQCLSLKLNNGGEEREGEQSENYSYLHYYSL